MMIFVGPLQFSYSVLIVEVALNLSCTQVGMVLCENVFLGAVDAITDKIMVISAINAQICE